MRFFFNYGACKASMVLSPHNTIQKLGQLFPARTMAFLFSQKMFSPLGSQIEKPLLECSNQSWKKKKPESSIAPFQSYVYKHSPFAFSPVSRQGLLISFSFWQLKHQIFHCLNLSSYWLLMFQQTLLFAPIWAIELSPWLSSNFMMQS